MLPFLYGFLVFALASGAGWLTYLDSKSPVNVGLASGETEIAAVTLGKHPKEKETADKGPEETHDEAFDETSATIAVDLPDVPTDATAEDAEAMPNSAMSDKIEAASPTAEITTSSKDSHSDETSKQPVIASADPAQAPQEKPKTDAAPALAKENVAKPEDKDVPTTVDQPIVDTQQDNPASASPAQTDEPTTGTPQFTVKQAPAEEKLALLPVPDPEIASKSVFGLLPIISPSGKMPWRTYARPFDDPLARPRIAIVMSEMGMSESATKTAIQKLPGAVTLSFNPYARDLQSWIEQSRAAGHEVLLQLPMEPFGYPNNDPGPHSLLTSLTDRENLNRLDWLLGRFTGYSGVTNQMGSRFTSSLQDMEPILTVLKDRGLLFLDGRTSAKSVGGKIATTIGMPVAVNNRFLDHKADRATIDKRLADLERIARFTGTAIGVGYPYPVTMERISVWARSLNRKGLALAPISAVVNRQEIQ